MKFSTKIILSILALASLCLIYYSDNYFSKKKAEKKEELSNALFFKTADVLKFTLKNKSGNFSFIRDSNKDDWKMIEPKKINTDQDSVSNALLLMSQINVQHELAESEELIKKDKNYLSQFGLDSPNILISVSLSNNKTETLKIGNDVGIGNKAEGSFNPLSFYGLNLNRSKVLILDATNISTLQEKRFSDFRTRRAAEFKGKDVVNISINSKNEPIILKKIQDQWKVLKPEAKDGDDNFISSFIQSYQSLLVQNVIEKEEVDKFGKQKYNLEFPAAQIKFSDSNGKILQEFMLGITKEGVYVQLPDGAVGKINLSSWPDYVPRITKFYNKQILHGVDPKKITAIQLNNSSVFLRKEDNWFKATTLDMPIKGSEKPVPQVFSFFSNFEYMSADDIILSPSKFDLEKYGLVHPLKKFSLVLSNGSKGTNPSIIEIFLGNKVIRNEHSSYLKRSDLDTVFIVNEQWVSELENLYLIKN